MLRLLPILQQHYSTVHTLYSLLSTLSSPLAHRQVTMTERSLSVSTAHTNKTDSSYNTDTPYNPKNNAQRRSSGSWVPPQHHSKGGWKSTRDRIRLHHKHLLTQYMETRGFSDELFDSILQSENHETVLHDEKCPTATETRRAALVHVDTTFHRQDHAKSMGCNPYTTIWSCGGKAPPRLIHCPPHPEPLPESITAAVPSQVEEDQMTQEAVNGP